jgi:tetratricopeptide (TPR) repeat protein
MRKLLPIVCLVLLPLVPYWQVQHHQFINLDDDIYVTQNPEVRAGLSGETLRWAFSFDPLSYWHPLTWLSHTLDCQLFGLNPTYHHFSSLFIHIANTLLLFLALRRMTAAPWKSFFVAAFFALHPLNVESVAWVADRKNVLSTFFMILTIRVYVRYAEKPGWVQYIGVWVSMALGLLAKPMLVTLPFVLLLLDYWPLRRWKFHTMAEGEVSFQKIRICRLLIEKIPLFALSAASLCISYISSRGMGFVIPLKSVPPLLRVENALVSYVAYIAKMILPSGLAVFYPFPHAVPSWQFFGATLVLICATLLVIWAGGRAPYLITGWFWYLGTLVPVLGLFQQGLWPALADRFAYIPLIGLFMIAAWGSHDLAVRWRLSKGFVEIAGAAVLIALGSITWAQVGLWKNSGTLFQYAVQVTKDNHLAHYNLGLALQQEGKTDQAVLQLQKALQIMPDNAQFHNSLGAAYIQKGNLDKAFFHLTEAIHLFPGCAEAHNNLGIVLSDRGDIEEAIAHYQEAIQIKPGEGVFYFNLGNAESAKEEFQKAVSAYLKALQMKPDAENVRLNLGYAFFREGRLKEALQQYEEILRENPGSDQARHNREVILKKLAENG